MPLILNASAEPQHFTVYGKHFEMKPGQIKTFQDHFARFISLERKYLGLVVLPEALEDIDFRQTEEGKKMLEASRAEGVRNRVAELNRVKYNLEVSLKRDLEMKNIKADVRSFASDGEIKAYEELLKYQTAGNDESEKKIERLKELEKKLAKG